MFLKFIQVLKLHGFLISLQVKCVDIAERFFSFFTFTIFRTVRYIYIQVDSLMAGRWLCGQERQTKSYCNTSQVKTALLPLPHGAKPQLSLFPPLMQEPSYCCLSTLDVAPSKPNILEWRFRTTPVPALLALFLKFEVA